MEECPGQRDGSTIYYFDGHMYRKNRSTDSSSYFRCATRGCMGRVIQKHQLGTIQAVSPHNHPSDPKKHNLRRFLAAMQRRVNFESIPIFEIYQQEASRFPGIEKTMPFQSLSLHMERRRRLSEINELNQSAEMKTLHFLNLCDIEDMTKSIKEFKALDPLSSDATGDTMQQMQEQSGSRDDPSSLEATFAMGGAAGMMDNPEAGPSGFMDEDVRVKMEPEWVDAGALEPNCELEGQFDDNQDFSARFSGDALSGTENQNFQMYNNQQQSQSQQLPLIQDSQDPVKLHVPGKPNLTITVAPTRQVSSQSSAPIATPPPLHLLNPLLNRKRGRPRGSAYGSYSESDDRVTTILTDSIIASQKLEKMGVSAANAYRSTPVNAASMPPSLVKPRSRDPEAVRAAEIVNGAQNRSGPRVTEELEKVHLKLRQEVLALEVQNLKAEREKLKAYRRNVAIRREIMALHLQLGKGFPSECASSGRGFETTDTFVNYLDTDCDNNFSPPPEPVSVSKKLPNVSITKHQTGQSPKISIRKSLQTSSRSPNASPLSTSSSAKGMTPPPATVNKTVAESRDQSRSSQSSDNKSSKGSGQNLTMTTRHGGGNRSPTGSEEASGSKHSSDNHKTSVKPSSDHRNNQEHESKESGEISSSLGDAVKEELVPLDSVSSDLSVEMLSEPGSSQWTTQSSAPMTEHEGFDDIQFEEDDSYDNTGSIGEFSGEPMAKEPPDGQYSTFTEDTNESKRRRVQNMWEPDEPL